MRRPEVSVFLSLFARERERERDRENDILSRKCRVKYKIFPTWFHEFFLHRMCIDTMSVEYIEHNRKKDPREEFIYLSPYQQVCRAVRIFVARGIQAPSRTLLHSAYKPRMRSDLMRNLLSRSRRMQLEDRTCERSVIGSRCRAECRGSVCHFDDVL